MDFDDVATTGADEEQGGGLVVAVSTLKNESLLSKEIGTNKYAGRREEEQEEEENDGDGRDGKTLLLLLLLLLGFTIL